MTVAPSTAESAATRRHRIAVVGCGPMGAAAARHLAEAGEDVLVVGPDEPADPARHAGPFASHYDEGRQAEYAAHSVELSQLARESSKSYADLTARTGVAFYRDYANLMVVPSEWKSDYLDVDRCLAIAKELGEEQIPLDDRGLRERFPMFRFSSDSRGLLEPRGGIINPRDLVRAQLAAARKAGATRVSDDVVEMRRRRGEVELETRGGLRLRADRVLLAAGGFSNTARLLERKLALHLSGVTVVLVEARKAPAALIPSVTFVLRSEAGPRVGFAMPPLPYPDGRVYLKCATGSSSETVLTPETLGDWYRGSGLTQDADEVVGLLRDVLPGFEPGVVRSVPCMVSYTKSGLPYVDAVDDRIFVAAGCNAIGVMTSDAIGRRAAAMLRGAAWPGPIAAERFRAQFVSNS